MYESGIIYSKTFSNLLWMLEEKSMVAYYLNRPDLSTTTGFANYISTRGDEITYMPAGRIQERTADGRWKREGRQSGKPAKIARKLLLPNIVKSLEEKDFEIFANLVKAQAIFANGEFSIVSGPDIATWYHESKYAPKNQSLNASCMRHDRCRKYFGLYTENPDVVSMLLLKDSNDLLLGRALLWNTEQGSYMDRIYGTEATINAFKEYAEDNKLMYSYYNSYDYRSAIVDNGVKEVKFLTVRVQKHIHHFYPWMDTLAYYDPHRGTLCNERNNNAELFLQHARGGPINEDMQQECYSCEEEYNESDMFYMEGHVYCAECFSETFVDCQNCRSMVNRHTAIEFEGRTLCSICYNDTQVARCRLCYSMFNLVDSPSRRYCASCAASVQQPTPNVYTTDSTVPLQNNEVPY